MSLLKKTKIVYTPENANPTDNDVLVDAVLNLEHISCILPGKKPGMLTVVMDNKLRYTIQDDLESLFKKEKNKGKGQDNDRVR